MKKIIILFGIFFSIFGGVSIVNANEQEGETHTKVITNTKIPGANCKIKDSSKGRYECNVPKSSKGVIGMFGDILKWFTFIVTLSCILAITIAGIMYSMGGANDELKSNAKKWIIQIIIGLVLLFSSGYILQLLAPWFFG